MKITLYTADMKLVVEKDIPPFMPGHEPRVVMWGVRAFALIDEEELHYREIFLYVIPELM